MHKILVVVVFAMVAAIGIGLYIAPDDLLHCDAPDTFLCQPADAIVVVSGGDTDARTDEAIRLFQAGWAPKLIVAGAAADKTSKSNAAVMRDRALSRGVPADALLTEEYSETTRQNAEYVAKLVEHMHVQSVIVVTSGYHMRRAATEFSLAMPEVSVRAHPVSKDKHWSSVWWLTPWGWWLAGSELVKNAMIQLGGGR